MDIVNPIANHVQSAALRLFADWQVSGRESVPPMGPLIVVANHQSSLDPPLLSASFPRRVRFLAKEELFRTPLAAWFLRHYGAAPLRRDKRDTRAYRWALGQLESDHVIAIFPEGTRNPAAMKQASPGVVRLALKSQAPLIPVGITGTERLNGYARLIAPTGKIRVHIGMPFTIPPIDGRPGAAVLQSLTEMVMKRVAALLPPSYRGVYALDRHEAPPSEAPQDGIEKGGGPLA